MNNILLFDNWLGITQYLTEEEQALYIGYLGLIRMGKDIDVDKINASDKVKAGLAMAKPMVEMANQKKEEFMEKKTPAKVGDYEIWQCARAHSNWGAKQVAEELGLSTSKVYHSDGWAKRDQEFYF